MALQQNKFANVIFRSIIGLIQMGQFKSTWLGVLATLVWVSNPLDLYGLKWHNMV